MKIARARVCAFDDVMHLRDCYYVTRTYEVLAKGSLCVRRIRLPHTADEILYKRNMIVRSAICNVYNIFSYSIQR
jgi:hypothetical protein